MQTSAGGASPDHVTGITGSQPFAGDPEGAGTLTQRLSVDKTRDANAVGTPLATMRQAAP
jgi:hypothetical protein